MTDTSEIPQDGYYSIAEQNSLFWWAYTLIPQYTLTFIFNVIVLVAIVKNKTHTNNIVRVCYRSLLCSGIALSVAGLSFSLDSIAAPGRNLLYGNLVTFQLYCVYTMTAAFFLLLFSFALLTLDSVVAVYFVFLYERIGARVEALVMTCAFIIYAFVVVFSLTFTGMIIVVFSGAIVFCTFLVLVITNYLLYTKLKYHIGEMKRNLPSNCTHSSSQQSLELKFKRLRALKSAMYALCLYAVCYTQGFLEKVAILSLGIHDFYSKVPVYTTPVIFQVGTLGAIVVPVILLLRNHAIKKELRKFFKRN